MTRIWIAQTTTDAEDVARRLAEEAVRSQLAACVHIDGPFTSVYAWEGKVEADREWRVTFKTCSRRLEALRIWLHETHSYDTPQWVTWEADASDGYGGWVADSTRHA